MQEQTKSQLAEFTTLARAIVENAKRMKTFLPMMDSPEGAIQAVQSVVSIIEQKKPVPPAVVPLLGVNVYLLMVDMAHQSTGEDPDPGIVKSVIGQILATFRQSHKEGPETAAMEQAEPAPEQMQEQQAGAEQPVGGGLIGRAMGA